MLWHDCESQAVLTSLVPTTPFTEQHTFILAMGITVVLALASAIGVGLKLTVAKRQPHGAIDNLNTRVNAWWAMSVVLGLALLGGRTGVTLLFAFASFVALREFVAPAQGQQGERALLFICFCVVLPLQYLFVASGGYAFYTLFIPLLVMVALPSAAAMLGESRRPGERTATVQWGLVICVYCISHAPALLTLEIPGYEGRNAFLLVFLILVVQSCDVLQYLWGKLAGRRKIAPTLSPSKTVEGSIGGIVSATALGAALSPITPFSVAEAALISLAMTLLGFLGGLILSAQKRRRGIKDWGTLIRGHGGMLDRLDSMVLSAPVFLHVVRIGWSA
jgi:phosphatidate cytidylyltransferase